MVWQWKGSIQYSDLVLNSTAEPLLLKKFLNDWIFALATTAEVVEKYFNLDACLTLSNFVAWVSTVDTCLEGSCKARD